MCKSSTNLRILSQSAACGARTPPIFEIGMSGISMASAGRFFAFDVTASQVKFAPDSRLDGDGTSMPPSNLFVDIDRGERFSSGSLGSNS